MTAPDIEALVERPRYRDFSEMPDDALRAFAGELAAIGQGAKLKDVRALRARAQADEDGR